MVRKTTVTFLMVGLLLLVTWLGMRKLNADGVWFDEWWSLFVAGADTFELPRSIPDIWERISNDDIRQGVLYPFVLAGWGSLTGWSEYTTRALSLFAGLISLAAVYRLGRLLSRRALVGFGAAVVLGTSVWFVYFLHEMRVYMLMVMLTALFLLIYHRIMLMKREPKIILYGALTIVTGLLLNTHYFAGLLVIVLGVWHLAQFWAKRSPRWWRVIFAWAFSILMLIPLVINLPRAMEIARNEPRTQPDVTLLADIANDTFAAFSNTSLALLALLIMFSFLAHPARRIWLMATMLLGLNLGAYYLFSLNELRYNMALLPLLALGVGFGVDELARRRILPIIVLGLWFVSLLLVEDDFQVTRLVQHWPAQPIREMAQVLQPHVREDDVIVNLLGNDNRPTLVLHPLVHYMGDFGAQIEVVENITHPGTQNFAASVRDSVGDARRVWLLYDPRWESAEWMLFEYLLNEESLFHCGTLADTPEMRIWGFARAGEDTPVWQFDDSVTLAVNSGVNNDLLQVWLFYQIEDDMPASTYSMALHMLDAEGKVRMQYDTGLPVSSPACQLVEIPVDNLPTGDYQLHAAIYNWQTGERLLATALAGDESDYPLLADISLQE